jgi:hypothetical protein
VQEALPRREQGLARSGIAVAMVGSLAREFLAEAPCDVLVARA